MTRFRRPWLFADIVLCVAIALTAAIVGARYLDASRSAGVPAYFYQSEFGPAVMAACGLGFVNPVASPSSPLADFLAQSHPRLSCDELDPGVRQIELDEFQEMTRYLLVAAAGIWRVGGVSWRLLDVLSVGLFSITIALVYPVFRLILSRGLAVLLSLLWMTSPYHLYHLPHLRDYAKAPFFVLTVLVIAILVLRPLGTRTLLGLSAALGAGLGLGFGIRTDVVINLVPFVATILLFLPGGVLRNLRFKITALAVCVIAFGLCAWSPIGRYRSGHTAWHVALLGLMSPFDQALGVRPSLYSFGPSYSDDVAIATAVGYGERVQLELAPPILFTPNYERVTRQEYVELIRTFPADFAVRAWASVIKVLNLPFTITCGVVPAGVVNGFLTGFYRARAWCLTALEGVTPVALVVLLLGLSVYQIRYAMALLSLVLFFAAYPVIQFYPRHVFHLEFIALWIDAIAVLVVARAFHSGTVGALMHDRRALKRVAAMAAAVAALVCLPLFALRLLQQRQVETLLNGYLRAPLASLTVETLTLPGGDVRLMPRVPQLPQPNRFVVVEMLVATVGGTACQPARPIELTLRYLQKDNSNREDFSHMVRIAVPRARGTVTTVFAPVYLFPFDPHINFKGIDVAADQAACVLTISRMTSPNRFSLLLDAILPAAWAQTALYQRFDDTEVAPPHLRSAIRRVLGRLTIRDAPAG